MEESQEKELLRKTFSGMVLTLLILGIATLAFKAQPVKSWTGTVYIRADGRIEPSGAPLTTDDYVTYTLTDDITSLGGDGIAVERDNIIFDGKGFTVEGWRVYPPKGIYLSNRVNVTIKNVRIKGFCYGIYLNYSLNNRISGNNITDSLYVGITIWDCSNNAIVGNNITATDYNGIYLARSSNNTILGNNIAKNSDAIYLWYSLNNTIYHNNFINNTSPQVSCDPANQLINVWDDGYPSGGNYWSDYTGIDADADAIGDAPCSVDANNTDRYPLMGPITVLDAGTWNGITYPADVVSNSAISGFYFDPDDGPFFRFNVTGEDGTGGFCRIAIPKNLLWVEDGWTIIVGDQQITDYTLIPDEDFTYLYFTYSHSTKTVIIQGTHVIPEFRSAIIMPLFIVLTMFAAVFAKRRTARKSKF